MTRAAQRMNQPRLPRVLTTLANGKVDCDGDVPTSLFRTRDRSKGRAGNLHGRHTANVQAISRILGTGCRVGERRRGLAARLGLRIPRWRLWRTNKAQLNKSPQKITRRGLEARASLIPLQAPWRLATRFHNCMVLQSHSATGPVARST